MFEMRTLRWASETGRSLSHLAKVRSARLDGKLSVSQLLERRGMVRRQAGSKQEVAQEHRNPLKRVGWVWLERRSFVDPYKVEWKHLKGRLRVVDVILPTDFEVE
jgi:hypothetical protein